MRAVVRGGLTATGVVGAPAGVIEDIPAIAEVAGG